MKPYKIKMLYSQLAKFGLITLLYFSHTVISHAEPYFAVRDGLKCSVCHSNITGGGKRSAYGQIYTSTLKPANKTTLFNPKLNDNISIGANFRANWTYAQFDKAKAVENQTSTPQDINDTSSFNISNGIVYLETQLNSGMSFYLDQQIAPEGGRTREAAVIWQGLPYGAYLKAGKFFLPYGLRLQDDQAFIRESTGFNFDNSDTGLELGLEPGPWSLSLAVSNGTQGSGENNKDKQVSLVGSYVQKNYRVGMSASVNNAPNQVKKTAHNIFGGFVYGKFNVLGEVDWINNEEGANEIEQLASFLAVNYLYSKALNLKLSYEYFDPNDDIDEDEQTRLRLLAELFLNQYSQLRTGIKIEDGIPQNAILNNEQLFVELHLFY